MMFRATFVLSVVASCVPDAPMGTLPSGWHKGVPHQATESLVSVVTDGASIVGTRIPTYRKCNENEPALAGIKNANGFTKMCASENDLAVTAAPTTAPYAVACKQLPVVPDDYKSALDADAISVRVQVPGMADSLYGILALCVIPDDAKGPAARAYRVAIPQEYVDATSDGRVSVVFEQLGGGDEKNTSWQLFLSRNPFPGAPVSEPPVGAAPADQPAPDAGATK
jgi:hypothetical protein